MDFSWLPPAPPLHPHCRSPPAALLQHSDKPDGTDDLPRVQRYRLAPVKLAAALQEFRNATPPLAFVLHLGDLIDGGWGAWVLTWGLPSTPGS